MQTHLVPKIMHQNLAVNLRQFNYSKKKFYSKVDWIGFNQKSKSVDNVSVAMQLNPKQPN